AAVGRRRATSEALPPWGFFRQGTLGNGVATPPAPNGFTASPCQVWVLTRRASVPSSRGSEGLVRSPAGDAPKPPFSAWVPPGHTALTVAAWPIGMVEEPERVAASFPRELFSQRAIPVRV